MPNKKKILVVEDYTPVLAALTAKINESGYEALQAKDGAEGLKIAFQEKPDLILLDLIMPVMDGLTMLGKLRENRWGKKVPVIVLTNLSDSENVAEAMAKGAYDYLVKVDWTIADVAKKIREKLGE